jgi:hypothetical protein
MVNTNALRRLKTCDWQEEHSVVGTIISFSCYTTSPFVVKHLRFTNWQTDKEKGFLGTFAKLRKVIIRFVMSVCLSVCPSAWDNSATPLEGFSLNFTFECFWTACPENSRCIKILQQQRALCLSPVYIYDNISPTSFQNDTFQPKIAEKNKKYILCSITSPPPPENHMV